MVFIGRRLTGNNSLELRSLYFHTHSRVLLFGGQDDRLFVGKWKQIGFHHNVF